MRKMRKMTAVLALYTVLMLGSASVIQADQSEYNNGTEQVRQQTETSTDDKEQTTEASTAQSDSKTTEEVTTTTEEKTDTSIQKKTSQVHRKKKKTAAKKKKSKISKKKTEKKKSDKKKIIPKVYNDHSLEMKNKKEMLSGFVYFNQADAAWNDNGYQIKSSGCGPTAMALCISSLTGNWVTPVDTAAWAYEQGYYSTAGASHEMIPALAEKYKLNCKGLGKDLNKIRKALKEKHPVVALMGPGYFTKKGHFIVLVGIDEKDQVTVADVGSRQRTRYKYPLKDVVEQTKSASAGGPCWEISNPKKTRKGKETKKSQKKSHSNQFKQMYGEIKSVLQKNYHLTVPLKKGELVSEAQFATIGSLDINDTVSVMDSHNQLKSEIELEQVVEEIETKAVKGSFWSTVTILPNNTNLAN